MIKQYRKKPVVIDAVLFDGTNGKEIIEWSEQYSRRVEFETCHPYGDKTGNLAITTLEGVVIASVGDYIIKGIHDELYPCKPDIFMKTYEEI